MSDRSLVPDLPATVAEVLAATEPGTVAVQLREKDLCGRSFFRLAERMRRVTAGAGAPLFVNDRLDVAMAVGADGVHLPASGLSVAAVRRVAPALQVACSTHGDAELNAAIRAGADLVVFGPVYDTPSKRPFGAPLGLEALREAAAACRGRPLVFGLGGIDSSRCGDVVRAGAHGVACIRAVVGATRPGEAARALLRAMERAVAPRG